MPRRLPLATAITFSLACSSCIFVSIEGDIPDDMLELDVRRGDPRNGSPETRYLCVDEATSNRS